MTRASDVKPHITVCTYTCDVCGSEVYQDVVGSQFMPLVHCVSQRCVENKSGGKINMQTRGSKFSKYQELRVQELPDQVPVGHIPRSATVHCMYALHNITFLSFFFFLLFLTLVVLCRGEQTRRCGPGDVVTIAGIFLTV